MRGRSVCGGGGGGWRSHEHVLIGENPGNAFEFICNMWHCNCTELFEADL